MSKLKKSQCTECTEECTDTSVTILPCLHLFPTNCTRKHTTCPTCKAEYLEIDSKQIFVPFERVVKSDVQEKLFEILNEKKRDLKNEIEIIKKQIEEENHAKKYMRGSDVYRSYFQILSFNHWNRNKEFAMPMPTSLTVDEVKDQVCDLFGLDKDKCSMVLIEAVEDQRNNSLCGFPSV